LALHLSYGVARRKLPLHTRFGKHHATSVCFTACHCASSSDTNFGCPSGDKLVHSLSGALVVMSASSEVV
jgi:hypothetical protein